MSNHDPFDLRAQEEAQADLDDRNRLDAQNEGDDFRWLMTSKRGRRIVWRWLERTGVYRSSFTGNSTTFFNEGQRNVGLMLMSMINEHAPEQYPVMLQEQKKKA